MITGVGRKEYEEEDEDEGRVGAGEAAEELAAVSARVWVAALVRVGVDEGNTRRR